MLEKISSYVKLHERLIIVVLVLMSVVWGWNQYNSLLEKHYGDQVAQLTEAVHQQDVVNKQLAQQSAEQTAEYKAMVDSLTRQNQVLAQAISVRNADLSRQQQKDETLPVPDLAKRWEALLALPAGILTPLPDGSLAVPESASRQTVTNLETIPVLTSNLKDTETIAQNRQVELNKADTLIDALNHQVTGLNQQVINQDKQCKAELSLAKAKSRKHNLKWFLGGAVAGAVIFAKIAAVL